MAIEVKYITTTAAKEPEIPVINGQIIAIKDTDQYYYDMGGVRRTASGQIHVSELPETGLQNMLYVLNSGSNKGLYAYDGSSFVLLASPNTDVAVTTTPDTTSTKVYLAGTTSASTATGGLKVDTDIYFDATTGKLTAKGFLGKATSAGSADSATVAINDSKSQNIASTYIKGLSVSGRTITYTKGDGTTGTITTQDTTYSNATQSAAGLMSPTDKTKLDGIQSGAQVNTVTGVKGNSETSYRTGNINITPTNIGLGNVTNESKATMFTNAALTGTPTAPTAASGTNTTQIASTAFVQAAIDKKIAAADAMIYKGTIGTDGTVTSLPATHSTGWTYKVITAGTYAGVKCEVGDMVICLTDGTAATDSHWTVVQNNIDGAVTGPASSVANRVAIFSGTSGKVIADSGYTIAASVPSGAKFTDTVYTHPSHTAYSSGLYKVTVNSLGHVTAATAVTKADITGLGIPGSDTNTHYNSYLYTGTSATATANGAASNGGVYLNLVENGAVRNSHLIKGTGATTVTADANGVITINSTNTTYSKLSQFTNDSGYITGITKAMVTDALGYTPPTSNTTYAQATASTLGLVKIGYTASGKNYPVALNSSGQMYVNVPWTDTNTDTNTHYTTRIYAGASGTAANAAATNPYVKITDDNTYRNQIQIKGGGATTVSSDANGVITISSTNTDTDTHYTSHLYVGASGGNANATTATANPYLLCVDNTTNRNSVQLKAGSNMSISAVNGVVTFTATNTTYSAATASAYGLVKVSSVNSSAVSVNSETTTAGRFYPVEMNNDGKLIVNVPWTDTNTNTTYSAGTGISLSGTTFSNSGVRSIGTGTSNGTISVNTNGTTANVAVKGLGSAAYTNSTAYAAASHSHSGYASSSHTHSGYAASSHTHSGYMSSNPVSIEFNPPSTTCNHGGFIDFHYNQSSSDHTSRIIESAWGVLSIVGTLSGYAKSSHGHSGYLYKSVCSSTTGSVTLSVKVGDIVILSGNGSGGGTVILVILSSARFIYTGSLSAAGTSSTLNMANYTVASLSSGTLTLTKINPWVTLYYTHYKVV